MPIRQVITEDGARPVKIWTHDIEEGAKQQLKNLARLPFIHGVSSMPDAHEGIGSCVGTVYGATGAIIPASVGVDIGCFSGDTKIPLLNGMQRTLKSLSDETEPFWVYSVDKNLNIVPGKAICKKTRTNAELMKVVVSGGEEIICTPDHQFMLNDGSYREARDLKEGNYPLRASMSLTL